MKKNLISLAVFISSIALFVLSCSKASQQSNVSSAGSTSGKSMSGDCMSCHKSSGDATGTFTVAGIAYDSISSNALVNCVVKLYTQPNGAGTLRATIYGNAVGRFYTTNSVDFSGGVYPVVTNAAGKTKYMGMSITQGSCNSCHGSSQGPIYVK